jgi:hypothetical protein
MTYFLPRKRFVPAANPVDLVSPSAPLPPRSTGAISCRDLARPSCRGGESQSGRPRVNDRLRERVPV